MTTKINVGQCLIGGGLITIGAAGIYYIHSREQIVREYVDLVKDLEREYANFMEDGSISEDEANILDEKIKVLRTLGKKVEEEGLLDKLRDLLAQFGFVVGEVGGLYIAIRILDEIRKRWPPRGSTPKDFKCPACDKHFRTEDQLRDHLEKDHQTVPDKDEARDAWELIWTWPIWVLDWIGTVTGLGDTISKLVGTPWDEIDIGTRATIIWAVLVAAAIIAAFCWWFLPNFAEVVEGFAAAAPAVA